MICPQCSSEDSVVYSAVSSGLVCLAAGCDWEHEMALEEVVELLPELIEMPVAV